MIPGDRVPRKDEALFVVLKCLFSIIHGDVLSLIASRVPRESWASSNVIHLVVTVIGVQGAEIGPHWGGKCPHSYVRKGVEKEQNAFLIGEGRRYSVTRMKIGQAIVVFAIRELRNSQKSKVKRHF